MEASTAMFVRKISIVITLFTLTCAVFAQDGNRGTADVTINGKKISINYGRPSLRGRNMLSQATVGTVWRLGMDKPTVIESAANLAVSGKELQAGKYSLWMKKTGDTSWIVGFHPTIPDWGVPVLREGYIAELPVKLEKTEDSAEQLTISLANKQNKAELTIHWGTSEFVGSFDVK